MDRVRARGSSSTWLPTRGQLDFAAALQGGCCIGEAPRTVTLPYNARLWSPEKALGSVFNCLQNPQMFLKTKVSGANRRSVRLVWSVQAPGR